MSAGYEIAKAGWLYRQSSVLHRWKKNWFVLNRDGLLRYFESQESSRADEVFILRNVCKGIKTGPEVRASAPPDEVRSGKSCMLQLDMNDGSHLVLCAESADDMRAWQYALEEARIMALPGTAPGAMGYTPAVTYTYERVPYGGYSGQIIRTPPPQVVQTPYGTTTVINPVPQQMVYVEERHTHNRYHPHNPPGHVYVATPRYW